MNWKGSASKLSGRNGGTVPVLAWHWVISRETSTDTADVRAENTSTGLAVWWWLSKICINFDQQVRFLMKCVDFMAVHMHYYWSHTSQQGYINTQENELLILIILRCDPTGKISIAAVFRIEFWTKTHLCSLPYFFLSVSLGYILLANNILFLTYFLSLKKE
jgi:hypothetical protein